MCAGATIAIASAVAIAKNVVGAAIVIASDVAVATVAAFGPGRPSP